MTDPTRPSPDEQRTDEKIEAELEADLEADDEEAEEEAEEVEPPRDEVEAAAAELTASGMADQIAAGELEPAPAPVPPDRPRKSGLRGATQVATPTAAPAETLPYVDDRVSKVWVILIALLFVALFFNAFFLGQGGFLTATPSPSPSPSVTVSPSPGGSPSVSPSAPAESPSPVSS